MSPTSATATSQPPLRRGWTTGSCATAAAVAAWHLLSKGEQRSHVTIELPRGQLVEFAIDNWQEVDNGAQKAATTCVIKDAGDDPDVTHGCKVIVTLSPTSFCGKLKFVAGSGVGTVSRPGLPLAIGEPAINLAPRTMIRENLIRSGWRNGNALQPRSHPCKPPHSSTLPRPHMDKNKLPIAPDCGLQVEIAVANGERLAEQTWNPRLGIVGGISILGSSGIVVPYSCAAWLASIKLGLDVALAAKVPQLAAATGKQSARALENDGLPEIAIIDMGDFASGLCKLMRQRLGKNSTVKSFILAGGIGKLSKFAQGHGDLHNKRSTIDFHLLSLWAQEKGSDSLTCNQIANCHSAGEALQIYPPLAKIICQRALQQLQQRLDSVAIQLNVYVTNRQGEVIATSKSAPCG